jgi:hypothetical protein
MRIKVMTCIALTIVSLGGSSCGNIFTAQVDEDVFSLVVSSLIATPVKWIYPIEDSNFRPVEELTVMAVYTNGNTRKIPVETVSLSLGNAPQTDIYEIPLNEGTNIITVSYGGKDTRFALMVGNGAATTPDDPEGGGNGGTTIEISPPVWE